MSLHMTKLGGCRLLGLEPEVQTCIFDFYQAILEATIAQARREGRYDDGIVDVAGTAISLAEAPQVRPSFDPHPATSLSLLQHLHRYKHSVPSAMLARESID